MFSICAGNQSNRTGVAEECTQINPLRAPCYSKQLAVERKAQVVNSRFAEKLLKNLTTEFTQKERFELAN